MMKTFYCLAVVCLTMLTSHTFAAKPAYAQDGCARMVFTTTNHNFGNVPRKGGDIEAEFEFVNDGEHPLVVTSVTTSCSCIKAYYSKRPVEAGGHGVIRLVYEPHKMEEGAFYKAVEVHSNSAGGVRILTVQGNSINVRKL